MSTSVANNPISDLPNSGPRFAKSLETKEIVDAIHRAAKYLPHQGPMSAFIHQNTLEAFQHMQFHDGVKAAHELLGGEPYLSEEEFRSAFQSGRIAPEDIDAVLREEVKSDFPIANGSITRRELMRIAMLYDLEPETNAGLAFLLEENRVTNGDPVRERIWQQSRRIISTPFAIPAQTAFFIGADGTHRDGLLSLNGSDIAQLIVPRAIRVASAYIDQGMAILPMPLRSEGLWRVFVSLSLSTESPSPIQKGLATVLRSASEQNLDAVDFIAETLRELGIPHQATSDYIRRTLLSLPGWSGIFHYLEHNPDKVTNSICPRLEDWLAVLLAFERVAVKLAAEWQFGDGGSPSQLVRLYEVSAHSASDKTRAALIEKDVAAHVLFRLFCAANIDPEPAGIDAIGATILLNELFAFSGIERRRLWQEAYERRYRREILNALAEHRRQVHSSSANGAGTSHSRVRSLQFIFCIDEREESLRRHLEEKDPSCETFSAAGFFGVAMNYKAFDASAVAPQCPVNVTPTHTVHELASVSQQGDARRRFLHAVRRAKRHVRSKSRGLLGGAAMSIVFGWLAGLATLSRVFAPRLSGKISHGAQNLVQASTQLTLFKSDHDGTGFTESEAVDRVFALLTNIGLTRDFSPLVFILGHGSTSQNNPHESAHDCGACGGRRGGPNARLFAKLANDPNVRAGLRNKGLVITNATWFIGGYHDTSSDAVDLYDVDCVPATLQSNLREARSLVDHARALSARERCRRFSHLPRDPLSALRHVQSRASSLSQPRPEYGHCTNAVAIIGRRALTRGLFLDRRPFLVSYDPTSDPDGSIAERIIAAAVPVGAGISLEYYFSVVDNRYFGCGTKLPHNVTGNLGVMDGHMSDLRTGLPMQMVELHEPVRLLTVVEATTEVLGQIAQRQPLVGELVRNGWVQLVSLHPETGKMHVFRNGEFELYEEERINLPTVRQSSEWYDAHAHHLSPARIEPTVSLEIGT